MKVLQLSLGFPDFERNTKEVQAAIDELASNPDSGTRGAVFTRPEVVEFILDLVGYTKDRPLYNMRLLEPSFGGGDFLVAIVKRLLESWHSRKIDGDVLAELSNSIRAVELHYDTFHKTYTEIVKLLRSSGIADHKTIDLANHWLSQGDFLLIPLEDKFDFVVGNPPYIRQEIIPTNLLSEYRSRYQTMYDRADIYIPFIERSLSVLARQGSLGFICSDRWMKNKYGGPLRRLIAEQFHLKIYVDMTDTPAFHTKVSAYPAITVINCEVPGKTRIAHRPNIDSSTLNKFASCLLAPTLPKDFAGVYELTGITNGSEPWLMASSNQTEIVRRLERCFPLLEKVGCKVGIGVATGADKVFIGDFAALDVEPDRKLPLVMTKDIISGEVKWRGQGVINPFSELGGLVDLEDYPRLRKYLEERSDEIKSRHCARKMPENWYRTIDRIIPDLAKRPKLLIPDIKGKAHIVLEGGKLYPHHNLYYIISEEWELRALQAVLLSAIAHLFLATYSPKIRGGFLRFQAQYLRRIRIPSWSAVPSQLRQELSKAATNRDIEACNKAAFKLYGLSQKECSVLGGTKV